MRVSKEQSGKNRQATLAAAKRLCRERGFVSCGVAEVMAEAGLTHGGFYRQFNSKEDLMAQACQSIFQEKVEIWEGALGAEKPLQQFAKRHLTLKHCGDPGSGCPVSSLSSDAARSSGPIREAYTEGVHRLLDTLTEKLAQAGEPKARQKAIQAWASVTGAVSMARAVDDPALAQEILDSVLESFTN